MYYLMRYMLLRDLGTSRTAAERRERRCSRMKWLRQLRDTGVLDLIQTVLVALTLLR